MSLVSGGWPLSLVFDALLLRESFRFDIWPERAPSRRSWLGDVEGHNINKITLPGSPRRACPVLTECLPVGPGPDRGRGRQVWGASIFILFHGPKGLKSIKGSLLFKNLFSKATCHFGVDSLKDSVLLQN